MPPGADHTPFKVPLLHCKKKKIKVRGQRRESKRKRRRFEGGRTVTQHDLVTPQQRSKLRTLKLEPPPSSLEHHICTGPTNTPTLPPAPLVLLKRAAATGAAAAHHWGLSTHRLLNNAAASATLESSGLILQTKADQLVVNLEKSR